MVRTLSKLGKIPGEPSKKKKSALQGTGNGWSSSKTQKIQDKLSRKIASLEEGVGFGIVGALPKTGKSGYK